MRKTKIVATLGPTSSDVDTIKKMIQAGMDAARINFSHGTYETHSVLIDKLKEAREELNKPIPLILDTKGPEIRIKTFAQASVTLQQGATFTLTTEDIVGDETRVAVTYLDLPKDLSVGKRVLIDDGLIELNVTGLTDTDIVCEVINSGTLSSRKGVNVPDVYVKLPSLTEKDIADIKFGIEKGFDYIAASFIRSANDVLHIREILEANGGQDLRVIAKIESRDGVKNMESILEVADGIMVARGDLGVEIPLAEVPLVQKELIRKANGCGRPVITATQMLESMVNNPRPTRAEANDVANAIFDGSDAIMLSGETAQGKYPVQSIQMMAHIALTAENSIDYSKTMFTHHREFRTNITNAISYAACTTASDLGATCIIAVTERGFTARMISRFRPSCPILAVTTEESTRRQLNLTWGCVSVLSDSFTEGRTSGGTGASGGKNDVFDTAVQKALENGLVKDGDSVVIAAGVPVGVSGTTNTLKVQIVGNVLVKGKGYGEKTVTGTANVIKVLDNSEKYFALGDILVTTRTTNEMMPYIKKASAIVVGSWETLDYSHAETVARALDKPLIICGAKAVDLIPDRLPITIDTEKGFVYNGIRN
ncbi:MAG: pyruvate kinase [Clostridiales bacterium]|jgi:pyruvate kinase|nr:pyruvate kinase [Clostridiales bacterium]